MADCVERQRFRLSVCRVLVNEVGYRPKSGILFYFIFFIVAVQLQSHAFREVSSQEIFCFKLSAIHEPHFWNGPTKPSQQHSVNETPTIVCPGPNSSTAIVNVVQQKRGLHIKNTWRICQFIHFQQTTGMKDWRSAFCIQILWIVQLHF